MGAEAFSREMESDRFGCGIRFIGSGSGGAVCPATTMGPFWPLGRLSLCTAETRGATYDSKGLYLVPIVPALAGHVLRLTVRCALSYLANL